MISETTKNTTSTANTKHETARQWLQRHLRKEPSIRAITTMGSDKACKCITETRPQTAPSGRSQIATRDIPPVPPCPTQFEYMAQPSSNQPPHRQARPNSGVIREVHAWLNGSTTTPSSPLMEGLSDWKSSTITDAKDMVGLQQAFPIDREANILRPSTSHAQKVEVHCPQPKQKLISRPRISHKISYRTIISRKANRRSRSVPNLGMPVANKQPPLSMPRTKLFHLPLSERETPKVVIQHSEVQQHDETPLIQPQLRYEASAGAHNSVEDKKSWQRSHLFHSQNPGSAGCTRPSTACTPLSREDSTGNISDAPTYSSRLAPHSRSSKAASILSTSSFGCIDGMNPEYRQLSQRRAAEQRSVKAKLKRFAQNFTT